MKPSSFSLSFSSLLAFFFISSFILTKTHGLIRHKKLVVTDPKVIPGRYIVEFSQHNESQPFADHLKAAFHNHVEINEHFDHPLFRGISFNIDDPNYSSFTVSRYDVQLEKMLDQDHISAIYPVNKLSRPDLTMHTFGEDSDYIAEALSPHRLTQVDRVHEELNNMGEGITVGIIDTGIDYFHPALGNGFGKGFKVALGEDLVGNEYDSNDRRPIIKPNPTPLDNCGAESGAEGHGTHVAGIVAGYESNFTGVAPKATLGMWRVFGCKGSTGNDIIIKALLKAYDAG
ncbi:peptidase S8/S53 domain-containing protein [Cunninghamella echinulata]|nr:peptidase S8/S53 domain-containing protein [Cunninghamella echinulata]